MLREVKFLRYKVENDVHFIYIGNPYIFETPMYARSTIISQRQKDFSIPSRVSVRVRVPLLENIKIEKSPENPFLRIWQLLIHFCPA